MQCGVCRCKQASRTMCDDYGERRRLGITAFCAFEKLRQSPDMWQTSNSPINLVVQLPVKRKPGLARGFFHNFHASRCWTSPRRTLYEGGSRKMPGMHVGELIDGAPHVRGRRAVKRGARRFGATRKASKLPPGLRCFELAFRANIRSVHPRDLERDSCS